MHLAAGRAQSSHARICAGTDRLAFHRPHGRLTENLDIDCHFHAIEDEALAIVVGNDHPLARKRRVAFESLLDYPWVLQPQGSPMRSLIDREFRNHGASLPKGLIETGSILTTINLIRRSNLVAVIPEAVALNDAKHGMLHVVPYLFGQTLEAYGSLVRRDRPLSGHAKAFLMLLHSEDLARSRK
jgi:DNA-binding transcriptional LysR family regulator